MFRMVMGLPGRRGGGSERLRKESDGEWGARVSEGSRGKCWEGK